MPVLDTATDTLKVGVIFNPASGMLAPESRLARLEEQLTATHAPFEIWETEPDAGARPLARRALASGVKRLLVSGGDGTIAEAAEVLAGTDVELAVIPGGTGNLLATNLGLPLDPATAASIALTGQARAVDVGKANGRVFLIAAGIGADARMIRDADRNLKSRFGILAYFIAAAKHFIQPLARYEVSIDGHRFTRRAQAVLIANQGRITGGVELIPGSDPADGLLDIAVIRTRTLLDALIVLGRALLGRQQSDNLTELYQGRHVVVRTARLQRAQVDGNDIGAVHQLEATVEPQALRLVYPDQPMPLLPDPATLVAEVVTQPLWLPLAVGAITAQALRRRAKKQRADGKEPDSLSQHPWALGIAAGLVTAAAVAARRRAAASGHGSEFIGAEDRPETKRSR